MTEDGRPDGSLTDRHNDSTTTVGVEPEDSEAGASSARLWLVVVALAILITWWTPITRPFYTNLRRDWTLLSYGLYACTLFTRMR